MAAPRQHKHDRQDCIPASQDTSSRAAKREYRILLVEDEPADAELMARHVRQSGMRSIWHRVDSERALRDSLSTFQPDIVLSDFTLPQFDGLSALNIVQKLAPSVPFLFVSGTIGEERAIEALRGGAVDYVFKTNLARLVPAITRALAEAAARLERERQAAQILRLTRVLRMLSGVNALVLRIRDLRELFEEACRLAVSVGGYSTAIILLQQTGATALEPVACSGRDSAVADAMRDMVAESAGLRNGVIDRVLKTGAGYVGNDTADLASTADASTFLLRVGLQSVVALPLLIDATAVGVLMLTTPDAGAQREEELQMLHEVAANLSFAMQYLQKDDAVRFLSHFDAHSGLAKHALFCERLARILAQTHEHSYRLAVAVLDVEQLSVINDSFGRHMGDLLLQHIADRLRRKFHDTHLLAQFGGGTYAVALDSTPIAPDSAAMLRTMLGAVFDQPFEIEGRRIPVVITTGLALYPDDGTEAIALVQNAEAALHSARSSGQRHLHYSTEQQSEVVARLALEHDLRTAIELRQFELHYQAVVNTSSQRIEGVEALIRWRHPEAGLIMPAAFLAVLERTGQIADVGAWVLEQAARDCQRWHGLGLPAVRIAVNISPIQLRRPDFVPRFLELTQAWASIECGLDIEITEGALLEGCQAEVECLKLLRKAGTRVAIDDFGTGYSSLSRLSELPIDTLKIDRHFISRLPEDQVGRTLVSTIITLAHALGMSVVAEGVENPEQLAVLRELACDRSQGFLFSKPLAGEDFATLLGASG